MELHDISDEAVRVMGGNSGQGGKTTRQTEVNVVHIDTLLFTPFLSAATTEMHHARSCVPLPDRSRLDNNDSDESLCFGQAPIGHDGS